MIDISKKKENLFESLNAIKLKRQMGIYKITNTKNNRVYIGSSISIYDRMNDHRRMLKRNSHSNIYLQRSWNKHGEKAFICSLVELVYDENKLLEREQYWMDFYSVIDKSKGYNISPLAGTTRGIKRTKEEREKQSKIMLEYHAQITEEERKERGLKISRAKLAMGHTMSKESRRKMSIAKKGKNTGKRPKEVGENISKAKMGHEYTPTGEDHWNSKYTEDLVIRIKYELVDGSSVEEISKKMNVKTSFIYDILNGRTWAHILPELGSQIKRNGKLTWSAVKNIKKELNEGKNVNEVAKKYDVYTTSIKNIKSGKTWSRVKASD